MSRAVLALQVYRVVVARRPDLRPFERDALVNRIVASGGAAIDRDGTLRLEDDARAMIGAPAQTPATPTAPPPPADTTELEQRLVASDNPNERARLREQIAKAKLGTAFTSTPENP